MAINQSPYSDFLAMFNELLEEASKPDKSPTLADVDFNQIARIRAEIEYINDRLESGAVKKAK
jgi:hypothetical protein